MFSTVASKLSEMHESYALRRTLNRELSAITTPEALSDIEAAITRCEAVEADWQTQEMRRVLSVHRSALSR